ncbi:40S ribosomal protein S6 [Phytophthora cinnamomi]|uniref:40S ribosomal protein S6 n=1 Tax=Phytophthora cinnamomi TaxID=4785 RepID=UPI00355A6553|nr:40S ribosomal protein S6 [Phytophthora cinnamomi]
MDGAAVEAGGARLQPADHEVIVISDDESESESERGLDSSEETSPSQTLSWPDVAEKLVLLAKHRELRADQQAVAALLRDLGVPTSANVNSCLRLACEKLGDLLAFSKGHNRRYRASEDLVLVLCEVLSLVPRQQGGVHVEQIKREPGQPALGAVLRELLQLMEKWRLVIEDCSRTSIGRELCGRAGCPVSTTISRVCAGLQSVLLFFFTQ